MISILVSLFIGVCLGITLTALVSAPRINAQFDECRDCSIYSKNEDEVRAEACREFVNEYVLKLCHLESEESNVSSADCKILAYDILNTKYHKAN